jgi:hypothetical protein
VISLTKQEKRKLSMILRNCKKLLSDISALESKISILEKYASNNALDIDLESLLKSTIEEYTKAKETCSN